MSGSEQRQLSEIAKALAWEPPYQCSLAERAASIISERDALRAERDASRTEVERLRTLAERAADMLDACSSGFIASSWSDMKWRAHRERMVNDLRSALT